MARLNAAWENFAKRGQAWDFFWQDAAVVGITVLNATDAGTGADVSTLVTATYLTSEAGAGDDSTAGILTATLFGTTDTGAGTEAAAIQVAIQLATDAGTGADTSTLVTAALFGTTDTGTGVEGTSIGVATLVATDASAGTDVVTTIDAGAINFATDSATGIEGTSVLTQLNAFVVTETGTGVEVSPSVVTHAAVGRRFVWLEAAAGAPIVAEALMENLVAEYGENRGRHVYAAMEREQKGPFAPGNKYDASVRPPQPVVVVQSRRPNPNDPPAFANAPKAADDTLRAFVHEALARTGVKKEPPAE